MFRGDLKEKRIPQLTSADVEGLQHDFVKLDPCE